MGRQVIGSVFIRYKKQAIIGAIEGRKGKAGVEIKEYDRSIQFSADGVIGQISAPFFGALNLSFAFLRMSINLRFH